MECIILAGGFGTRLTKFQPKPLAPICKTPFLDLLIHRILQWKEIDQIILSIGYQSDKIISHYKKSNLPIRFSVETSPLGTGGALQHAAQGCRSSQLLVMNGDTFFPCAFSQFFQFHLLNEADLTIVTTYSTDASRFGIMEMDAAQRIHFFREKEKISGYINTGTYLVRKTLLETIENEPPFSLEKEIFPQLVQKRLFGYPCLGDFIDIGTDDSYQKAQEQLKPYVEACKFSLPEEPGTSVLS